MEDKNKAWFIFLGLLIFWTWNGGPIRVRTVNVPEWKYDYRQLIN